MRRTRYNRLRNLRMYSKHYRKPLPRGQRVVIFFLIFILIIIAAISIVLIQLRPVILDLGTAKARATVLTAINTVIDNEINQGTFDYSQLVEMDKDDSGNIAALMMNTPLLNTLQARLSKEIVTSVQTEMVNDLRIPIGNAIGGILFSGRGPTFVVKILSVQNIRTGFSDDFSDAGFNQVRHKIMLNISVDISVYVPGTKTTTTTVTTRVEACNTIIVGKVPNVYADLGD